MTAPAPVSGEGGVDAYARLAELNLVLPEVAPPLAAYVPAVQSGNLVYVSGQLPMVDGKLPLTGNPYASSSIVGHTSTINGLCASADGKFLISSGLQDGLFCLWQINVPFLSAQ